MLQTAPVRSCGGEGGGTQGWRRGRGRGKVVERLGAAAVGGGRITSPKWQALIDGKGGVIYARPSAGQAATRRHGHSTALQVGSKQSQACHTHCTFCVCV